VLGWLAVTWRRTAFALIASVVTLAVASPALAEEGSTTEQAGQPTQPATQTAETPAPTPPDNSKSSLLLVGGQSAVRSVPLTENSKAELIGTVVLGLRSKEKVDSLLVSYVPSGNAEGDAAGSVALAKGTDDSFGAGREKSIPLVFTLPEGSSPEDLNGTVVIRSAPHAKAGRHRLEVVVSGASGAGASLAGVSIQPEKLEIDVVSEVPTSGPTRESAQIQLSGPGVPALLASGRTPPFDLLLRSDHGDEVHAKLVNLEQGSTSAVATAEVKLEGRLKPGKYEGSAPLSALSPTSPKLSIEVESGNSLLWALLVVFLGAVLGGALYLASGIHRRKALLRDEVKSLLRSYSAALERAAKSSDNGRLPLWTLDPYLGEDRKNWYTVKWNAVLDFDGAVRTIWSDIHWARNDDDLDEVAAQVAELRARIVRWVTVANSVTALRVASKLKPKGIAGHLWEDSKTQRDTELLLERIREIEPGDDQAGKALIERINRQARWHVELAEAWNARAILTLDVTNNESKYDDTIKDTMKLLDLEALDKKGSPEAKRDAEAQVGLTIDLEGLRRRMRTVYKGDQEDLKLKQPLPPSATIAAPTIGVAAATATSGSIEAVVEDSMMAESTRAEPKATRQFDAPLRRASASGSTHDGERIGFQVEAILRRDLLWTVATALAASVAYIPTIYSSTWGTPSDYLSAFVAGFLGKVAINWAALPFFRSLKPKKSDKSDEGTTAKDEGDDDAAGASSTGDAAAAKGAPATSQVTLTVPAIAVQPAADPKPPPPAPPPEGS
jgi:hypothetical protein